MAEENNIVKNDLVSLEMEDEVAVIVIDNPPVNSLNSEVMESLSKIVSDLYDLEKVRAVIITGAGERAFVAGADIKQFEKLDEDSGKELAITGQKIFEKINQLNKPVICAINGVALGGGCELALACDIRIASENAKIGLPEVGLGIIPGYGGTQRLARLLGTGKAKYLIFSGEQVSAEEAYRIGFVESLVRSGEALQSAKDLARKISKNSPLSVEKAKQSINEGIEMSLREGLHLEADLFGKACATEDKNEGAKAFLEKRSPIFRGQ